MESRILGVPLAVWCFMLGMFLIVALPCYVEYRKVMSAVEDVKTTVVNVQPNKVEVTPEPTVVQPTVAATPSARPLSTPVKPVVTP